MNTLKALRLPDDLVSRLLASIEEVTARVLTPDSIEAPLEYLEFVLLAPAGQRTKGYPWGFFRVERASTDSQLKTEKGHCVEYYLYLDQKRGR
jgi:hypothetical protein